MNSEELAQILSALQETGADTAHVEIKSATSGFPARLWETLSAFANTPGGGILLLGITESEQGIKLAGVNRPDKFQADVASLCDQMIPPLRPLIEIHEIEGKSIVTVEVPEVSYKDKPCHYRGSGLMSGSFIRVADGDRQLTQYEVQGFLDGRGQPIYDLDGIPGAKSEDLSPELVNAFLSRIRERHPKMAGWDGQKILKTFRILAGADQDDAVSLAGIMCFGKFPQSFLPGLSIHVLAYPHDVEGRTGTSGERLLDDVKIEGPLLTAVPEAIGAVKKNLSRRVHIQGLLRQDKWQYPDLFLREAIVNAVAHRDYSPLSRGAAIQIKIFPNRIEIINPGGLFGPVTENRLGEQGLQSTRNTFLMKLLEDAPVPGENKTLCENRGTGIPSMIQELRIAGMEPPEFRDSRTHFRTICRDHSLFDQETLAWLSGLRSLDLTERQRYALAYVRARERLTNPEYCRMNDCDSRVATRELSDLVKRDLLEVHGARRWAFYTLKENGPTQKSSLGRRQNWSREIIAFVDSRGTASSRDVREHVGFSLSAARFWISRLVKQGHLAPTTQAMRSRNVKYKVKK